MSSSTLICPCPCPCPCPVEEQLVADSWGFVVPPVTNLLSPGNIVESPTGAFKYEVKSYGYSILFRDLRGEFEKYSWKKFISELEQHDLSDEEFDIIVRFIGQWKSGNFIFTPCVERFDNLAIFLGLINFNLTLAIELTHKFIPHLDNSPWVEKEKGKWERIDNYPATYDMVLLEYAPHKVISKTPRWLVYKPV